MGFDWSLCVDVAFAVPIEMVVSASRMCTRSLMLKPDRLADSAQHKTKRHKKRVAALPGSGTHDEFFKEMDAAGENGPFVPFSETEEELATLDDEGRALYAVIKKAMNGDHGDDYECGGLLNYSGFDCPDEATAKALDAVFTTVTYDDGSQKRELRTCYVIDRCFQRAVDAVLPGRGHEFGIEFVEHSGAYGEPGEGAEREGARIVYKPSQTYADGSMDTPRGGVNVPWGYKTTPIPKMSDDERKQVEAGLSVIVEKLGFSAKGPPNLYLITNASGG